MMYQDRFVGVVKVGKRILREFDRSEGSASVRLPFGSEYSIYLKNLHAHRAVVSITIDGQDVLGGSRIVVDANSTVDIERFLDRMDKGNRFKFIKKTQEISEHRGDRIDDGIVRIEWQFEQSPYCWPNSLGGILRGRSIGGGQVYGSSINNTMNLNNVNVGCNVDGGAVFSAQAGCLGSTGPSGPTGVAGVPTSGVLCDAVMDSVQDDGITVKGSVSNQQFTHTYVGALDPTRHVMTLMLRGTTETLEKVSEPFTVQSKVKCTTCGTMNRPNSNYCSKCGTAVAIKI